jgi:hypothetical protein
VAAENLGVIRQGHEACLDGAEKGREVPACGSVLPTVQQKSVTSKTMPSSGTCRPANGQECRT